MSDCSDDCPAGCIGERPKPLHKSSKARLELAIAYNKGIRAACNAMGWPMDDPRIRPLLQPGQERT